MRAVTLLSGHAGRWIAEELEREGIETEIVWTPGESRASLSVADRETAGMTEFYEDGTPIDAAALGEFCRRRRGHRRRGFVAHDVGCTTPGGAAGRIRVASV